MIDERDDATVMEEGSWSSLLGNTEAFVQRMQQIAQEEARASDEDLEGEDIVATFAHSLTSISISYEISGRAIAKAHAAYGEFQEARLRLLAFSSQEPETIFDAPIDLPGVGMQDIELPKKVAFVLAAVGIIDSVGNFHPVAHAAPLTLNPATLFPPQALSPIWATPRLQDEDVEEQDTANDGEIFEETMLPAPLAPVVLS